MCDWDLCITGESVVVISCQGSRADEACLPCQLDSQPHAHPRPQCRLCTAPCAGGRWTVGAWATPSPGPMPLQYRRSWPRAGGMCAGYGRCARLPLPFGFPFPSCAHHDHLLWSQPLGGDAAAVGDDDDDDGQVREVVQAVAAAAVPDVSSFGMCMLACLFSNVDTWWTHQP